MKHTGPTSSAKNYPVLSEIQHVLPELSRREAQWVQNAQQYASMNFARRELIFQFPALGGRKVPL